MSRRAGWLVLAVLTVVVAALVVAWVQASVGPSVSERGTFDDFGLPGGSEDDLILGSLPVSSLSVWVKVATGGAVVAWLIVAVTVFRGRRRSARARR